MKPMVVSAAAAGRTPTAAPRVKAAPPCMRCRREILAKSMGCSFGGLTADHCAASPDAAEPGEDVAIFVPMTSNRAMLCKLMFYISNFMRGGTVQKLCRAIEIKI